MGNKDQQTTITNPSGVDCVNAPSLDLCFPTNSKKQGSIPEGSILIDQKGHVYIHRKIRDWAWYDCPNVFALFIHFIIFANWKDGYWRDVEVKRGEFISSLSKLSKSTGLTIKQIRNGISSLKRTQEIQIISSRKYTHIKLVNYEVYQDPSRFGHDKGHSRGTVGARKGQQYNKSNTSKYNIYGEFKHVKLTDAQYQKLLDEFGLFVLNQMIKNLDEYIQMKGKTYKDHNLTMRKWQRDNPIHQPQKTKLTNEWRPGLSGF